MVRFPIDVNNNYNSEAPDSDDDDDEGEGGEEGSDEEPQLEGEDDDGFKVNSLPDKLIVFVTRQCFMFIAVRQLVDCGTEVRILSLKDFKSVGISPETGFPELGGIGGEGEGGIVGVTELLT